jgi:putative heme-binding domain-containing protein
VYRVRYTGTLPNRTEKQLAQEQSLRRKLGNELYDVLTANQPLANWSRARWDPAAKQIGMDRFERVTLNASVPTGLRIRALEVLTELGPGPSHELLAESKNERDVQFLARLAWAISRSTPDDERLETLFRLTTRPEPSIRRAAWEAVCATNAAKKYALRMGDHEPFDRMAVQANWTALRQNVERSKRDESTGLREEWAKYFAEDALSDKRTTFDRLAAIRQMQVALGDIPHWTVKPEVFVGYSPATKSSLSGISESLAIVAARFPYDDPSINLEMARLFAIAEHENPRLLAKIVNQCTSDSRLEDDIHYLIVLSRLPGARTSEVTSATASALGRLHRKLATRGDIASRNWPLRVGELIEELCNKDDRLPLAIIDDENFGLVEHSLFVSKMSGGAQLRAARKLLEKVNSAGHEWDTDLLSALKVLPLDELRPFLHDKFNEPGLRDSIALILAQSPVEQDRAHLVEALSSVQSNVVRAAASALAKLNGKPTPDEIGRAVAALRQQTLAPNEKATRHDLGALLVKWSGQKINVEEKKGSDLAAAYRPWFDWFAKVHPEEAKKLTSFGGDLNAWNDRLGRIDWSVGDANRGKAVYERRACHRCHSASGRLGPDLAGAAARFSREDLFAAILDPNRDVAPLYQTTEVVTNAGQSYNGLIVYESPDTTMIQTSPDTVVRLTGVRKDGMRKSNLSLMPTGLLNEAADQDIADLYEYLKTLKK